MADLAAVHQHSLTWVPQVIHLQCFILSFENLDTDNSESYKKFWVLCNFNMSCRTRICGHEPCQVLENGYLASSHNQVCSYSLCTSILMEGYTKGANLCCHPFSFDYCRKLGWKKNLKLKFSGLAYSSGQIL